MSVRLQVVVDEGELAQIRTVAARHGLVLDLEAAKQLVLGGTGASARGALHG